MTTIRRTIPALLAALALTALPGAAHADDYSPNAACNTARPNTPTARTCTDHGWTIRARIIVDSRGVLRNLRDLKECTWTDDRGCYVMGRDLNHGWARVNGGVVRFDLPRT